MGECLIPALRCFCHAIISFYTQLEWSQLQPSLTKTPANGSAARPSFLHLPSRLSFRFFSLQFVSISRKLFSLSLSRHSIYVDGIQ